MKGRDEIKSQHLRARIADLKEGGKSISAIAKELGITYIYAKQLYSQTEAEDKAGT